MNGVEVIGPWWSWNRRLPAVVLGVLALGFAAMALAQAWSDAPTFDEPVYVAAGVVAVTHHDLWMNDEHPPLAKVAAALPALMAHPVVPDGATRTIADEQAYSAQFVHANLAAGRLRRVMFLARLVPIAESIAVAAACWVLASAVAGPWAGLVAGGLWLASPTTLGLGHLDGIDLPFTLVTVLLAIAVDRYHRSPSRWRAATVGGGAALALGVRNTGLLVAPIAVAVVALLGARVRGRRDALGDAALAAVLAWVGLWAVYLLLDPSQIGHIGVAPSPFVSGLHR
ncbi:MAG TPA: hypothetical protein VKQ71_11910, partial [Acidimicrobiales bacterium]|nr:hypothetical protein [Acidimicrobiales bacterium]